MSDQDKHAESIHYRSRRVADVSLGGRTLRMVYRPALAQWNSITPAEVLLADAIRLPPDGRVLHFGFGSGILSAFIARYKKPADIWLVDINAIAYDLAARTLGENSVSAHFHWEVDLPNDRLDNFDIAVIELPKGRKLAQRWLRQAYLALREGGTLYIAGPNKGGIQSILRDTEALFGSGSILSYKKGSRVSAFLKQKRGSDKPAWFFETGIAQGTWHEMDVQVGEKLMHLNTLPGVFSYDRMDSGTALLLEQLQFSSPRRVLDLGCGSGILGLFACHAAKWVDLVDSNLLAVATAQRNLELHNVLNASAMAGDVTDPVHDRTYEIVVANPPFHAGHGVDYAAALAFIEEAHQVLVPGGELWLVANRFLRYNPTLQNFFGQVEMIAANNRYQVYRALKSYEI